MNIQFLVNTLNYYTKLYDEGHPAISDKEWDELYFKLQKLEEDTGILLADSPSNVIYWHKVPELKKIEHDHPMLSLDKTKDPQVIKSFLNGQPFVAMFKMDGLTCSLTYENGHLVRAETRGNGLVGEDIFHNMLTVKGVPVEIPYKEKLVVDGEIICRKDDFVPFEKEYKNPRNFAAGSIRLLSSKECQTRNLSFVAWEMIEGYSDITEFWRRLEKLEQIGFTIVPMVPDIQWVDDAIEALTEGFEAEHKIYPIDGYVFKFNDVKYGKAQGQTDHHLKNAIAYKLYDEEYDTKLIDIELSIGRTGVLTPVAIFEPIEIDGAIVERASLHNLSVMNDTLGEHPYKGQSIKVFKSNQIIPQISWADKDITNVDSELFIHKTSCPVCGGDLEVKNNDGIITIWCGNENCEGKLVNKINHFCGKKGLDIKGLSKATLEKLLDWGWIESIADLYSLSEKHGKEFVAKPGFGDKSVTKILNAIEDSKHTTLEAFISAIGIPLIGKTIAKEIVKYYPTWEEFREAVGGDWTCFDGFGPEMNAAINSFDYSEADRIAKLLNFKTPEKNEVINNTLEGKNIVITGKLINFKNRNELKAVIEKYGGKVVDSISSKTNILINNDVNSTSAKNKAAKDRNIPILSEADFIKQYIEN